MLISPLTNNFKYSAPKPLLNPNISFRGNVVNALTQKAQKNFSPQELIKILTGDFRKLTTPFFEKLSDSDYKFCLEWAKGTEKKFSGMVQFSPRAVLPEDVSDVVKYADFYYSGLQNIAKSVGKDMNQVLLVGIGQSPVATIKLLELTGIKTAHCPISGLTNFNEAVEKYVTPENVDKYFSFWKKFGFNLDELFGDKLIIFTDHRETGRTFEVFKQIIKRIIEIKKQQLKKGHKKPAKIKFLSLSDIYKTAKKEHFDNKWGDEFEKSVFHTSYLKTLYSPLFKLPLPQIKEIVKRYNAAKGSDRSIRFNQLTVLLFDKLYNKTTDIPRRFSSIDADRRFRLSFFTPSAPVE